MKKLVVVLAILAIAVPAFATTPNFQYYKGTGSDGWGVQPTVTSSGWSVTEPQGTCYSVNGCDWMNIACGAGPREVSFDLVTQGFPAILGGSGESQSEAWTEVYILNQAAPGTSATAQACMAGTAGSWIDKLTVVRVYEPGVGWVITYRWASDHNTYNFPGYPGYHIMGQEIYPPMGGFFTINDVHHLDAKFGCLGNIFIGIKTGIYNVGGDPGISFSQHIENLMVTPEPSSLLALGSGLFGLVGLAIRRRK